MPKIKIDQAEISVAEGTTILQAAEQAGIYIPRICFHPAIPPVERQRPAGAIYRGGQRIKNAWPDLRHEGCELCVVEIEGLEGLKRSCSLSVSEGMIVNTVSSGITEFRRDRIMELVSRHPHACFTCAQREGCARFPCSLNIPEAERCCPRFADCEFQSVVAYVGLRPETPRYVFADLPIIRDDPLFEQNLNLCIGCTRCIRMCRDVCGVGVFDFVHDEEKQIVVGTVKRTLKESSCRFCGLCVEVCPTGALMYKESLSKGVADKDLYSVNTDLPLHDRRPLLRKPTVAPHHKQRIELTKKNLARVPEAGGVYQLLDQQQNVIYIKGAMNLRKELEEEVAVNKQARYFVYEENPLYSMRESELLQQYVARHGEMPELNRELADLF
jgi:formate hydrogenlyase subunit 6/NADH:ubiquinone oxidoreductase subunit I